MIETVELLSLWRGPILLRPNAPALPRIAAEVAAKYGVTVAQLKGRGMARWISQPRQEAMARMRAETRASTTKIGQFFGRDHSTVIHACRAVAMRSQNVPAELDGRDSWAQPKRR